MKERRRTTISLSKGRKRKGRKNLLRGVLWAREGGILGKADFLNFDRKRKKKDPSDLVLRAGRRGPLYGKKKGGWVLLPYSLG